MLSHFHLLLGVPHSDQIPDRQEDSQDRAEQTEERNLEGQIEQITGSSREDDHHHRGGDV